MPIIKSAIKKMRSDVRRRSRNLDQGSHLKTALKKAAATKKFADVSAAYSALDRAVKSKLVKRNFANRQKAALSKLAKPVKLETNVKTAKKPSKKSVKKSSAKKTPAKRPAKH